MFNHLIVQAGGRGSRMGYLTENKPKCLISIHGKPLLYALGNTFKGCRFYIIADYKSDVLKNYLKTFPPPFKYQIIKSTGRGTASGIKDALKYIPKSTEFGIVWSDIYFNKPLWVASAGINYIGITDELRCRWSIQKNELEEKASSKNGIVGFFSFANKETLKNIPESGEFVKFLKEEKTGLLSIHLKGIKEIGTLEAYNEIRKRESSARFFNSVTINAHSVVKKAVNKEYSNLIDKEKEWYKFIMKNNYAHIPQIISFSPFIMERVIGKSPNVLGHKLKRGEKNAFAQFNIFCFRRYAPYGIPFI